MISVTAESLREQRVTLAHSHGRSHFEDATLAVVADAAIDNEDSLRARMGGESPANPAEWIACAYRHWGTRSPAELLGDFAFVVWDKAQHLLFAARDPIGVRPLYWTLGASGYRLGSVCRQVAGTDAQPNRLSISRYILRAYNDVGESMFDGVQALPPAHAMVISADRSSPRFTRYWTPRVDRQIERESTSELQERFRATFKEAVSCRAKGQALAVEVSGGIDSAAVACQAAALAQAKPPTALNLSFPNLDCNETDYCDAVVGHWKLGLIRSDARATPLNQREDEHADMIYDPNLSSYEPLLAQAQARGVTTVLTGLGGDQTMDESGVECADALREGRLGDALSVAGITSHPFRRTSYRRFVERGLRQGAPLSLRRLRRRFRRNLSADQGAPLSKSLFHAAQRYADRQLAENEGEKAQPRFGMRRELVDQANLIPLVQSHRLGLRYGIQFRHPFLDRRLVELMVSVPPRLRLRHGVTKGKPLLRAALKHHLPPEVHRRGDAGEFSSFLRYVLLDKNRERLADLFENSRLEALGVIDGASMQRVLRATTQTHLNRLSLATGMELWLRRIWT